MGKSNVNDLIPPVMSQLMNIKQAENKLVIQVVLPKNATRLSWLE